MPDTLLDRMIRYENGDMNPEEIVEFYQTLVDEGLAWSLQGHYGRVATHLIEEGLVSIGGEDNEKSPPQS